MRELEEQFSEQLAVIGVHSGKFIAERETARIADAARRLGVAHPVVNDRQFRIWRSHAVRAWPTIVVIDPNGYALGMHAGEFTAEMVAPTIRKIIDTAGGSIQRSAMRHEPHGPVSTMLRYPGKVAVSGTRLAIADSANDRIVVADLNGAADAAQATVSAVYGGTRGYRDGDDPLFDHPQGLLFDGDRLLVADAFNHAIREIDLTTREVRTVAGTGRQLRTRADLAAGALSSPWDLARVGDDVAIAMAGNHRIYLLDREAGRAHPLAGSGAEAIDDGPLDSAALAQPMGICSDGSKLYFADAESSAIREADLQPQGTVGTIVGTGLFDFGDVDGDGTAVRLQHPQGILHVADGRLLIVDSYNDALKWLDRESRRVTTWIRGLHEPEGAAAGDGVIYIADTNAHRIAVAPLAGGEVVDLSLDWGAVGAIAGRAPNGPAQGAPTRGA